MGRGNGGIIGPTNDPKFCGSATFTFNAPGTFKAAPSTSAVNALLIIRNPTFLLPGTFAKLHII